MDYGPRRKWRPRGVCAWLVGCKKGSLRSRVWVRVRVRAKVRVVRFRGRHEHLADDVLRVQLDLFERLDNCGGHARVVSVGHPTWSGCKRSEGVAMRAARGGLVASTLSRITRLLYSLGCFRVLSLKQVIWTLCPYRRSSRNTRQFSVLCPPPRC